MDVLVKPSVSFGNIDVPSSKSYIHRSLICASLAKGVSTLTFVDYSKDIEATIEALEHLGIKIVKKKNELIVYGGTFNIIDKTINCYESGSTLRFMIPLCSTFNEKITFVGSDSLLQRPQEVYQEVFNKQNKYFSKNSKAIVVKESLQAGKYILDGSTSSQFITGLLLILPTFKNDSTIEVVGTFESQSYVDITIDVMNSFGVKVKRIDNIFYISGNQKYINGNYENPNDYSQLAFFALLGVINNNVIAKNMQYPSIQGDSAIIDILKKLGAKIEYNGDFKFKKSFLNGGVIDIGDCPDLGPILFVAGLFCKNDLHLINTKRLAYKESNRILVMVEVLKEYKPNIIVLDNEVIIKSTNHFPETLIKVDSFNDHRVVMALSVLASVSKHPVLISNASAINKSYPNFFKDMRSLNIDIKEY